MKESFDGVTAIEVIRDYADEPLVLNEDHSIKEWRIPVELVGPLRAMLNYYDETEAYARLNKESTLSWFEDMVLGFWGDIGTDEETWRKCNEECNVVLNFIAELKSMPLGGDAYQLNGLDKIPYRSKGEPK